MASPWAWGTEGAVVPPDCVAERALGLPGELVDGLESPLGFGLGPDGVVVIGGHGEAPGRFAGVGGERVGCGRREAPGIRPRSLFSAAVEMLGQVGVAPPLVIGCIGTSRETGDATVDDNE